MTDSTRLAEQQLRRMRGMTGLYHKQFFRDITITTVLAITLFVVGWWAVPPAFLLIPAVSLMGAVQTAFDSSYLIFARWYALYLDTILVMAVGIWWFVGGEGERRLEATLETEFGAQT